MKSSAYEVGSVRVHDRIMKSECHKEHRYWLLSHLPFHHVMNPSFSTNVTPLFDPSTVNVLFSQGARQLFQIKSRARGLNPTMYHNVQNTLEQRHQKYFDIHCTLYEIYLTRRSPAALC